MEILLYVAWVLLSVIAIVAVYFLLILLGTIIPVNSKFRNPNEGVDVYISSNGVHTDFIIPAVNHLFDWSKIIDSSIYETPLKEGQYIGVGWGDKGFYLDTPTWAELSPYVALKAMCVPSRTLMHITSYDKLPDDSKMFAQLYLSDAQFLKLCEYMTRHFAIKDGAVRLIPDVGYTPNDNFYHAVGKYHAFNTCNFWVNHGLLIIGVRTALWSPLDRGIFYQLKKMKSV